MKEMMGETCNLAWGAVYDILNNSLLLHGCKTESSLNEDKI